MLVEWENTQLAILRNSVQEEAFYAGNIPANNKGSVAVSI
jgi:hypothetical protein